MMGKIADDFGVEQMMLVRQAGGELLESGAGSTIARVPSDPHSGQGIQV